MEKTEVPKLPLLVSSSPGAVETCAQLLHGMPRRRATAEPNTGEGVLVDWWVDRWLPGDGGC